MESKTEEANQINKKPFRLSLKPLKNSENEKKEKINKLTDVLISYNIMPFLKLDEAKESGKINKRVYNAFVRYYLRIRDSLISKYNKYNIKLENEDDYNPKEIYEQKDDKGHFIRLGYNNLEHYLLFSYFKWTWQDSEYWDRIKPKNSILGKDICHLKTVCLVDVNASMTHVYSGKYKLYLNHCVCNLKENMLKMTILIDGVPLKEFIYPSREQVNVCREVHSDKNEEDKKEEDKKDEDIKEEDKIEENNPNLDVIRPIRRGLIRGPFLGIRGNPRVNVTYNKQNSLNKIYIMDVDIIYDDKIDSTNGHEITVKFDHTELSWKNGWLIDAVILESLDNKA